MSSIKQLLLWLMLVAICRHQGLCDDQANCDPCLGIPECDGNGQITWLKNCTCDGSRSYSWCYTKDDMSEWRYCTPEDRNEGFNVAIHCLPIDCSWSSWSEWSNCDTDTDTGHLFTYRSRNETKEINGGKPCCDGAVEHDDKYCYENCATSAPCQNGGTCEYTYGNMGYNYYCICPYGYYGKFCEKMYSCIYYGCQNLGTCQYQYDSGQYQCVCPSAISGAFCEIDACSTSPCLHGGYCYLTYDYSDYECSCYYGYNGTNCQDTTQACPGVTCQNNGYCNCNGLYCYCSCNYGYYGDHCENAYPCTWYGCYNGGTCYSGSGYSYADYYCACLSGYTGHYCETYAS